MLNKFLKLNSKILKKNNSNEIIALVNRERPLPALESSTLISALANSKKLDTIIITDRVYNNIHSIYESFGFSNFYLVSNFKNLIFYFYYSLLSLLKTFNAYIYILNFGFKNFTKNFKIKDILVGDLIYDTFIRHDLEFLNLRLNFKFFKITFLCFFKVFRLNNFFLKNNVKYLFIHTDCFVTNEALSMRLALKKNIRVMKINSTKKKIYLIEAKKHEMTEGFMPVYRYFPKNNINKKILIGENKLSKFISDRFKGKVDYTYSSRNDLINANKSKKKINKSSLIKKLFKRNKKFERIILFAPHAFSDAPHHMGNFLFRDYWDQFVQTIEFMKDKKFKNYLWLIRPHPSSYLYKEDNLVKRYIKNNWSNIKLCETNIISTKYLIDICDTVITGRGTIGLEFACFGKKPIIAGQSTYSNFGIANEHKNKKEYFASFGNLKTFKKLNKHKILTARKILYYIESVKPLFLNKKLDHLIMNTKNKSIFNLLNENHPIISKDFLKRLNEKKLDKDQVYRFFKTNANYL